MKEERKRPTSITIKLKQDTGNQRQQMQTQNKNNEGQSVIVREGSSPCSPMSPRKKKGFFMTQKKLSDVQTAFGDILAYIDVMDDKITKVIQKNESQFLIAYRNHNKRIRQQMQEIKNRALSNANSSSSQTQKIQTLQKQLSLFRQDSLRLFEQITEKGHIIANLQKKISQLTEENRKYQSTVKQLMKKNKTLQIQVYSSKDYSLKQQPQGNTQQFKISQPIRAYPSSEINKSFTEEIQIRPNTTAFKFNHPFNRNSINKRNQYSNLGRDASRVLSKSNKIQQQKKDYLIQTINHKIQSLYQKLSFKESNLPKEEFQILKQQIQSIIKTNLASKQGENYSIRQIPSRTRNKSRNHSIAFRPISKGDYDIESKGYAKRTQLQQYFHKCIQTVKKEITRRRGLKSINFYNQYGSLTFQQFKNVDFFRLLEILLSNQKILQKLYQTIFDQSSRIYK